MPPGLHTVLAMAPHSCVSAMGGVQTTCLRRWSSGCPRWAKSGLNLTQWSAQTHQICHFYANFCIVPCWAGCASDAHHATMLGPRAAIPRTHAEDMLRISIFWQTCLQIHVMLRRTALAVLPAVLLSAGLQTDALDGSLDKKYEPLGAASASSLQVIVFHEGACRRLVMLLCTCLCTAISTDCCTLTGQSSSVVYISTPV